MIDDELIAELYRAASGLDAWSLVLGRIAEAFKGLGIHVVGVSKKLRRIAVDLHSCDATGRDGGGGDARGSAGGGWQSVIDTDIPVGQVLSDHGRNGQSLADTPFYRDHLSPHGYRHVIGGKICDDDELVALLGVGRGPGQRAFGIREERRLEHLLKHFANAMDLMRDSREWQTRSNIGEALLGRSRHPSFLVGHGAKLLFANEAGQDAFRDASIVVDRQGVLAASDVQADAKLKCALCALGVLGAEAAAACSDRITLWLNDIRSGHRVPACLWAIRSRATLNAFGAETMGILILASANARIPAVVDPDDLVSMFGFTPAEARIAAHLIAGLAPKQIARTLGLGMPTVRSHIRHLLLKCKCRDQRQLVRCLAEALAVSGL